MLELNKIYFEDCLAGMEKVDDKSIDMILCDLPYGTTACKWDSIIPFEPLWEHYKRIIKKSGAIVLFGSQPFTSLLISSNLKGYKYNWVWEKSKASNFVSVKNQPLKNFEDICVFTANGEKANYYPQMVDGEPYKPRPGKKVTEVYNEIPNHMFRRGSDGKRYPKAIQYFKTAESEGEQLHSTQKPVSLCEYLIKTYTLESELVLDNCAGSGTTAIASINTNRNWILFENDCKYYPIAFKRIDERLAYKI
jgi:site-specific DNA-methyltransferase (adenine-specific)